MFLGMSPKRAPAILAAIRSNDRPIKVLPIQDQRGGGPATNRDSGLETSDRRPRARWNFRWGGTKQTQNKPNDLSLGGSIRYMDSDQNKPKPSIFHAVNWIERNSGLFLENINAHDPSRIEGAINALRRRIGAGVRNQQRKHDPFKNKPTKLLKIRDGVP